MHDLGNEALAFLKLDQGVNCELDILAILDIVQVGRNISVIDVNLLEKRVESTDDVKVALLERVV